MIIRHAHQSGRFDATPDQQAAMLEQLVRTSSVAVVTEAAALEGLPDSWLAAGHETRVLYHVPNWRLVDRGTIVIPTPPWTRGTTRKASVDIEWAALHSREDPATVLLRGGGHLPAHLFHRAQRAANAAALRGLASALAPVIEQTNPDEVTLSFDFNRPLTSTRHAKLITDAVAPLGLQLVVPPKATRGLRVIDGFLTTARLTEVGMLRRMPGYDHRGARMHTCADCGGQA